VPSFSSRPGCSESKTPPAARLGQLRLGLMPCIGAKFIPIASPSRVHDFLDSESANTCAQVEQPIAELLNDTLDIKCDNRDSGCPHTVLVLTSSIEQRMHIM
jgi:hypothetical protein